MHQQETGQDLQIKNYKIKALFGLALGLGGPFVA